MHNSVTNSKPARTRHLWRFLCFVVFATVGMAAVGIALLAGPLTGYYGDRAIIEAQQQHIAALQEVHTQQQELLANADNPSVVERAAVYNLRYVPVETAAAQLPPLPNSWPTLERALAQLEQPRQCQTAGFQRRWVQNLADQTPRRYALLILGSALVLISLSCFHR